MEELKDDMLKRTYHIESLCHDAETVGIQTVITLADQDEQLKNIKSSLSTVDVTLIHTKQNINRLKGITHRVVDSIRAKFHQKVVSKIMLHPAKKQNELSLSSSASPRRRQSSPKVIQQNIPPTISFTDGQIDNTLNNIGNVLHRLKDIAQDMNDQLAGQAETLDDINAHMTKSTICIQLQNIEMKNISLNS